MMSVIKTVSLSGLSTEAVFVETDLSQGLPALNLVGLPGTTVRESKERVRVAILNTGNPFPMQRITVNLSPASTKKEGSSFDLPIAVGILCAQQPKKFEAASEYGYIGELSLDGKVNPLGTAFPLALGLKEAGVSKVILPKKNLDEVLSISDMEFYPVETLREVAEHLSGEVPIMAVKSSETAFLECCWGDTKEYGDYADVKGQNAAKRAFQICAAGGHDISLIGSPGIGKSMLAHRLPTILPELTEEESIEVTKLYVITGNAQGNDVHELIRKRPFRTPHHNATPSALIGGGSAADPGELTLADHGILFLDELAEFDQRAIDMMRQPLENGYVDISRHGHKRRYPCRFILVTAMNPCPCGYYGDPLHHCTCPELKRKRYLNRISGPMLDRIDIHITLSAVSDETLYCSEREISTEDMRKSVSLARGIQQNRFASSEIELNGTIPPDEIGKYCVMSDEANSLVSKAHSMFSISARQSHRIVRVARTIADLEGSMLIERAHIAEAIGYRRRIESEMNNI
jgi:magnesium chelatase family protein